MERLKKKTVYHSVSEEPFKIYGLDRFDSSDVWTRVPEEVIRKEEYSPDMDTLVHHTAGGRVRFKTDSPYIIVRAKLYDCRIWRHFAPSGSMGLDVYAKPVESFGIPDYIGAVLPDIDSNFSCEGECVFPAYKQKLWDVTVNLPTYAGIKELSVGIDQDSNLYFADPYLVEKPVLFYGSSITQGACCSRPGNTHTSVLSRMLDCNIRNMGFSGSAYGEKTMAEYISGLEMSAFVMEYDYNARSEDELLRTHFSFYKTVREKNPQIPIIMVSAPVAAPARIKFPEKRMSESRVIVMESYLKGYRGGDRNLYFVDGEGIIGSKESLIDGVHPNDLGFRNMAQKLYPVLRDVLYHY